jgi:hypothetical protein
MAHFAELDENNTVIRVVVINNDQLLDDNDNELEEKGIKFCERLFGGRWIQASYNGSFRNRFPSAGYSYDETADVFIEPQPYLSWTLNTETYRWEAPVLMPDSDMPMFWNESTLNWEAM